MLLRRLSAPRHRSPARCIRGVTVYATMAVLAVATTSCTTVRCPEQPRRPAAEAGRREAAPPEHAGAPARPRGHETAAEIPRRAPSQPPTVKDPATSPGQESPPSPEDHSGAATPPATPGTLRAAIETTVTAPEQRSYVRALRQIASMLRQAGAASVSGAVDAIVAEAQRLERLDAIDLDRADRIRAALDAAAEGLGTVAAPDESFTPWADAAATAVRHIDPAVPLGLQRAAVQDALRATADALIVALERSTGQALSPADRRARLAGDQ